jgi:hypothetical protein
VRRWAVGIARASVSTIIPKERLAALALRQQRRTTELREPRDVDRASLRIALLVEERRRVEDERLAKLRGELRPCARPEGDRFHEQTRAGVHLPAFQEVDDSPDSFAGRT